MLYRIFVVFCHTSTWVSHRYTYTHSSVLAWRIPGTGEPGGLPSMEPHRVGHDWSDLAAAAAYIYPLPFETPSHLLPLHPTLVGWYRVSWAIQQIPVEFDFPEPYRKFPPAMYFTYGNIIFHVTLSIHLTLSSPFPMSISLFSMSVSSLLPCKEVLQYHSSRFRIYVLAYDIYLSLSDLLHSVS